MTKSWSKLSLTNPYSYNSLFLGSGVDEVTKRDEFQKLADDVENVLLHLPYLITRQKAKKVLTNGKNLHSTLLAAGICHTTGIDYVPFVTLRTRSNFERLKNKKAIQDIATNKFNFQVHVDKYSKESGSTHYVKPLLEQKVKVRGKPAIRLTEEGWNVLKRGQDVWFQHLYSERERGPIHSMMTELLIPMSIFDFVLSESDHVPVTNEEMRVRLLLYQCKDKRSRDLLNYFYADPEKWYHYDELSKLNISPEPNCKSEANFYSSLSLIQETQPPATEGIDFRSKKYRLAESCFPEGRALGISPGGLILHGLREVHDGFKCLQECTSKSIIDFEQAERFMGKIIDEVGHRKNFFGRFKTSISEWRTDDYIANTQQYRNDLNRLLDVLSTRYAEANDLVAKFAYGAYVSTEILQMKVSGCVLSLFADLTDACHKYGDHCSKNVKDCLDGILQCYDGDIVDAIRELVEKLDEQLFILRNSANESRAALDTFNKDKPPSKLGKKGKIEVQEIAREKLFSNVDCSEKCIAVVNKILKDIETLWDNMNNKKRRLSELSLSSFSSSTSSTSLTSSNFSP